MLTTSPMSASEAPTRRPCGRPDHPWPDVISSTRFGASRDKVPLVRVEPLVVAEVLADAALQAGGYRHPFALRPAAIRPGTGGHGLAEGVASPLIDMVLPDWQLGHHGWAPRDGQSVRGGGSMPEASESRFSRATTMTTIAISFGLLVLSALAYFATRPSADETYEEAIGEVCAKAKASNINTSAAERSDGTWGTRISGC